MLPILITLLVILGTAYYVLVMKPQEEERLKKLKQQKKQEQLEAELKRREEEAKAKKQQAFKKKKKVIPQQKKQKQVQEKGHDPSDHPRYIRRFGGHQRDITAIALSPDGEWMATTCVDGQLRVARVDKDSNPNMFVRATIDDHDQVSAMSWEGDNRTIACVLDRTNEIAHYRIRKKKDAAAAGSTAFPYELIELVKRRYPTGDKFNRIGAVVVDQSSTTFHLLLASGDTPQKQNQQVQTIMAWDGMTGQFLSMLSTGSNHGPVRVSHDGKFICGRCRGGCNEVKLFEIIKKRHKGEVDPQYDSLPPKSIMTLTVGKKVADVGFLYDKGGVCDKAVVVCMDGTFQIWNLNVEYRQKEDPKKILECSLNDTTTTMVKLQGKDIVALATNPQNHQFAIATSGSSIHLFTYDNANNKPVITHNFSMEDCHGRKGTDDISFDPMTGTVLYSKGTLCKDVFSWNVAV